MRRVIVRSLAATAVLAGVFFPGAGVAFADSVPHAAVGPVHQVAQCPTWLPDCTR